MHRSTGHSVMQIGEPAHPVQESLITAINLGFRFLLTLLFVRSATAIFQYFMEDGSYRIILTKAASMYSKFPAPMQAFGMRMSLALKNKAGTRAGRLSLYS